MIKITDWNWREHPVKSTWAYVEPGDVITYQDGSSYYVNDCQIKDATGQTTLLVSCIVGPENPVVEWQFGDKGMLCVNAMCLLPFGATITKG